MKRNLDYQKQKREAYPIQAVLILSGGIVLVKSPLNSLPPKNTGKRREIKALSRRSLDRLSLVALSTSHLYKSILTLTYGQEYPMSGREVKLHIKKVLQWLSVRGCKDYLWFLEFQDRNAPHIHFLLDFDQTKIDSYHKDLACFWAHQASTHNWKYCSIKWNRKQRKLIRYGKKNYRTRDAVYSVNSHPQHWEILRSKDGGARYAMKYAMKKEQKKVPSQFVDIGRFWATPQHLSLPKLVKTWTYTDEEGALRMCEMMGRDFSNWAYLPKIIIGNTDEICNILVPNV